VLFDGNLRVIRLSEGIKDSVLMQVEGKADFKINWQEWANRVRWLCGLCSQ
jgi:hypothetical protein